MDFHRTVLGIELGSTRIKAVLLNDKHQPIASGSYGWENSLTDGIWTYPLEEVHKGLQSCYADLKKDVQEKFGETLTHVGALGVSSMMHGYLAFDKNGELLVPFRTWRNTITGQAAEKLTGLFGFNIPQRWSIAHLYQAMLKKEAHLPQLDYLTTLAGYIHRMLTGERILGIGDASGMFPIDSTALDYDAGMCEKFDALIAEAGYAWRLRDILPKVLVAGENAGALTEAGARFLDPDGDLLPGIPAAPCEGDAGTGMAATNSVRVLTGNVSAGTSDFAMIVTDRSLRVHREIDMVTTPDGLPVAMVHCNNCTSDINAWAELFRQFAAAIGKELSDDELYPLLFNAALSGDADCGGLLSYNYFSGEGVTDVDEGRPVFLRLPDSRFTLQNFMRTHLLSALSTLKIGLDILTVEEKVSATKLYGHGGFFKTPVVGQKLLSAAAGVPVSVMQTAGEGGPYGMALLCAFMLWKKPGETLPDYLDEQVFAEAETSTVMAEEADIAGFNRFLARYKAAFPVERTAAETLQED